ncbi:DNA topoisomerase I [Leptospira ryugenii]|uniref:DNA topoisomerase n=1 Tax=Leptospira ryugenii TaxID=1917863 RepID=A0A2P2DVD7_9LEPT|nr:DNA topoisomerase I [Leptospira ryugenii]
MPKYRIRLKEISKRELWKQIEAPSHIDSHLVTSQVSRRVIDRIFGFELSPVLWKALKMGTLSAGRVQSAVLRWICEREKEIRNFQSESYLEIQASIYDQKDFILTKYDLKDPDALLGIEHQETLKKQYLLDEEGRPSEVTKFTLIDILSKAYRHPAPKPFTTASLQEYANKHLSFSPSQTMSLAQSLYEGKKKGKETIGLITYMRTDSTRISEDKKNIGFNYLHTFFPHLSVNQRSQKPRKTIGKQDAHEAITPTRPDWSPDELNGILKPDELKLYTAIWERFYQSLLAPETGLVFTYLFESKGQHWKYEEKQVLSPGFLAFKDKAIKIGDGKSRWSKSKQFDLEQIRFEEKQTKPKERYSIGQIVAKMERTGIGRPSTYSATIETLLKRKYILHVKSRLGSTSLGERVCDFLVSNCSNLIQDDFTKKLEQDLDELAQGKNDAFQLIDEFYKGIKKIRFLEVSKKRAMDTKKSTDCPNCLQGTIQSKFAKNGKTIYFCSRYPKCNFVSYESPKSNNH